MSDARDPIVVHADASRRTYGPKTPSCGETLHVMATDPSEPGTWTSACPKCGRAHLIEENPRHDGVRFRSEPNG